MNRRTLISLFAGLGAPRIALAAAASSVTTRERAVGALIAKHRLVRARQLILQALEPTIGFSLLPAAPSSTSRLGGGPRVPKDFVWPTRRKGRRLDFLLQVDLAEVADDSNQLPRAGHLAFFYDLADQPWGFDPADLDAFRVFHFPAGTPLMPRPVPDPARALPERGLRFNRTWTLPSFESLPYDRLQATMHLSDEESDRYGELVDAVSALGRPKGSSAQHQLLGHSRNIQEDMQLEAQLVTNGLYCGDQRGYADPRRPQLEKGADRWRLLLQLDSDDDANMMWGDTGMLYFWIRKDDLPVGRFEKVWMALQCG